MPSSALSPLSPGSRRRAARDSKRSESPPVAPRSLAGVGTALAAVADEEEVARLTAVAVASALAVPLGAVVLLAEGEADGRLFGQLSDAPLDPPLAEEMVSFAVSSLAGAGTPPAGWSAEIDVREEVLPAAAHAGLRRLLMMRLGTPDRSFGTVMAGKGAAEPYGADERAALETLADQASVTLYRVDLNQRLSRRTEELSFLDNVPATVSTAADLTELLNLALEQTIALSAMEGGVILLLDEESQRLTLATERNLPPGARESLGKEQISVGELIPGITVQRCQLLVVENSKDDEREVPAFREAGVSTHVSIPVAFGSRALGVLSLVSRRPCAFSQSELDLFATVGQQIGVAVERARLSEKRARVAERIKLLDELTRVAVSSLNVAEIFDQVSEQVNKLVEHDRLSIDLRPHGEDYCEAYAIAGDGPPKGTRVPLQESPAGEVSLTGRPILRTNWPEEAVYSSELVVAREHGLCSAMFVPLQARGRVIGTLSLASRQPARYSEPELRIAQEIADHLAVIVEHSLLHEESKELAVIQERTRLAHELHDALAQSFISIILELDLTERMMRTDLVAGRRKLARTRELAQEGLEETRRAILALRPAALETCSLSEAVGREIELLASEGVTVNTSRSGTVVPVAEKVETAIYGIARAALANIRRHAKATSVDAVLDYGREALTLTIADNGVGFDIPSGEASGGVGGFGLKHMRERARALNGEVQVASAPGRGTCVTVRMPYGGGAEPRPERQPKPRAQHEGPPPLRVLLADDHVVARQGTCRMLEEAPDIEVVAEARDGIEALAKARAFRPDVLIADIRMPGMGGIELVSALKDEGLPTRAIILTAFLEDGLISEAMRAGAQGYVLKDVGGPELISAVRAVHRGETFLQSAVASELGRQVRDTGDQGLAGTLTSQERRVLSLVARGLRNKEIARELGLSEATVKFHVTHIFEKLGVSGRTEALGKAVELGIVSFP